jgi:solute carrier family 23 (nucleobase transporter), member 1
MTSSRRTTVCGAGGVRGAGDGGSAGDAQVPPFMGNNRDHNPRELRSWARRTGYFSGESNASFSSVAASPPPPAPRRPPPGRDPDPDGDDHPAPPHRPPDPAGRDSARRRSRTPRGGRTAPSRGSLRSMQAGTLTARSRTRRQGRRRRRPRRSGRPRRRRPRGKRRRGTQSWPRTTRSSGPTRRTGLRKLLRPRRRR